MIPALRGSCVIVEPHSKPSSTNEQSSDSYSPDVSEEFIIQNIEDRKNIPIGLLMLFINLDNFDWGSFF